jgi:RNA-directed DNA polymerase
MNFDFTKLNNQLERLESVANKGLVAKDLYRIMYHPELWQLAYTNIYSNKGAITKGIDDDTLDGFSFEKVNKLINKLKEGQYRPKPVRRTYIPKRDGSKRPLGVPSGTDKLVQSAGAIILGQLYEPIFHNSSHGFRPNKSCQTALEEIKHKWTGMRWFIEFDIKGCFDNIDHDILIRLLSKRIDDKRFLKIIHSHLKVGYMEEGWKYHKTLSGTPQGGTISPLLSNIYLHELDSYVHNYIEGFSRGNRRPQNKEYTKLRDKTFNRRKKIRTQGFDEKLLREIKELQKQMLITPASIENTNEYRRLRYCRYADDFICGVIGSYTDARTIKEDICSYIHDRLNLETAPEKTLIRKTKKGIEFLGYGIRTQYSDKVVRRKIGNLVSKKRSITGSILLFAPLDKTKEFNIRKGYGDWDNVKGQHRPELLSLSDAEIVTAYNAELRGFANFYSLARDVKLHLSRLQNLSLQSLVKTLANKHKTTVANIFFRLKKRNEHILEYETNGKHGEIRVFKLKHMNKSNTQMVDVYPTIEHLYKSGTELTQRMTANECEYCGQKNVPFEVHHVKKLKDLRQKSHKENWEKTMIKKNRKTLVLCIECHRLLHTGKLPDVRKLKD